MKLSYNPHKVELNAIKTFHYKKVHYNRDYKVGQLFTSWKDHIPSPLWRKERKDEQV